MPFLGVGLHLFVALFFGIHAVRRGRDLYWLIILFSFPLLGSLAYFFVVYLPEMRESRTVRAAGRAVVSAIDPGRGLRAAREAFELTPTIDNRLRLAEALLDAGDRAEALRHYEEAAQGPFSGDLKVMQGLAAAQLENGQAELGLATLERLFAERAEARRHPRIALICARALAEAGREGAREAFEIALEVGTDAEPKCRFADWLTSQSNEADLARAQGLYRQIVQDSRHWHRHAKAHNAEWLRRAQAALSR